LLKPDSLIGFAVGKTTDGLHKLISKDAKKNPKRWKKLKAFQIDENIGAPPNSLISFSYELRKELKNLFKILNPKNIFLIDGTKKSKTTIKEAYSFIRKNKGFDLIVLGLGPEYDPHIAYNTAGQSSINSRMRVVRLHPKVSKKLRDKAGKSLPWQAPTKGITIGLKDILDSKKILLIVYGKEKAKSLRLALKKVSTKVAPASALLLHKDLYVLVDKNLAKHL